MDQTKALNALAPFLALSKSATSPRAAADLITQATGAPGTWVFSELLQQPNIQALAGNEQYGGYYELLRCFSWGTWEDARVISGIQLSEPQTLKLRLLTVVSIASEKHATSSHSNLSYASLCSRLGLRSPTELEQLVVEAIYANLLTATLNPARQMVIVTSVAPLRDLAPGSVHSMMEELERWSQRCTDVLDGLEMEIAKIHAEAAKRHAREQKTRQQIQVMSDAHGDKTSSGPSGTYNSKAPGSGRHGAGEDDHEAMDWDGDGAGQKSWSSKKRMGGRGGSGGRGGMGAFLGRMAGSRGGR